MPPWCAVTWWQAKIWPRQDCIASHFATTSWFTFLDTHIENEMLYNRFDWYTLKKRKRWTWFSEVWQGSFGPREIPRIMFIFWIIPTWALIFFHNQILWEDKILVSILSKIPIMCTLHCCHLKAWVHLKVIILTV